MGLAEQMCYTLTCDRCGALFETDYVMHFASDADARQIIDGYDWQYDEEAKHYLCSECPLLRPSPYWEKELGIKVYDPDGWRKDGKDFNEPISEDEFWDRADASTTQLRHRQEATP